MASHDPSLVKLFEGHTDALAILNELRLQQPGVSISASSWQAVGMADSGSMEVTFDDVVGETVGRESAYVARPGFMQGGAGIAACWFGGAVALAAALHRAVAAAPDVGRVPLRSVALGKVDMALCQTAALLREAAAWIDHSPRSDVTIPALRVRQSADACARVVLDEVGRALGATPFCRDRNFAKMAADLAVFTRQSLAERDFQLLGERLSALAAPPWQLQT